MQELKTFGMYFFVLAFFNFSFVHFFCFFYILNSDFRTVNDGGVDGKMAVYQTHFELELLTDTANHIVDVRREGTQSGQVLGKTVPHVNHKLVVLFVNVGVDVQMLEFALQSTMLALDGAHTGPNNNFETK